MQKGKIVEMAEADQLYLNPQSDYTKKLIDAIPNHLV
jgi:peptide/nickel transport system ATP-binding protein